MQECEGELQRSVFVFNLSSCVREEILYELFLQAGPVQKVVIPKDRDGNPKSYGFVYYKHTESVPYAIALLDGIWLYGCPITLRRHYAQTLRAPNDHSWGDGMWSLSLGSVSPRLCPTVAPWTRSHGGFVSGSDPHRTSEPPNSEETESERDSDKVPINNECRKKYKR